jgi:hypothetical protein
LRLPSTSPRLGDQPTWLGYEERDKLKNAARPAARANTRVETTVAINSRRRKAVDEVEINATT